MTVLREICKNFNITIKNRKEVVEVNYCLIFYNYSQLNQKNCENV